MDCGKLKCYLKKHKGKTFNEILTIDKDYIKWLVSEGVYNNNKVIGNVKNISIHNCLKERVEPVLPRYAKNLGLNMEDCLEMKEFLEKTKYVF